MIWIVITDYFIYIVCNTKWLEGAVSCNAFRITFIIWRSLKPFVDTCWETIGWCLGGRSWRQGPDDCSYVVTRGLVFILSRAGKVLRYSGESSVKACCASIDARSHKPKMFGIDLLLNILFQIQFQDIYDVHLNVTLQTSHHIGPDSLAKNRIVDDGKLNPIRTGLFEHI